MPNNGDIIVFPYLTPAFKTTIGSPTTCTGGTQYTMGAVYPGTTSSQVEFMSGVAFQSLNAGINASATQFTGNLAVHPQWFATDNVGSHGLVQIDSEQMFYRVVANESNTFLNLTRGVNGTTAASHSTNALIVPLNPVEPARPWPVIPSLTVGTATTPVGAEFYPAGAVGNAAYAMPLLSGANVAYVGIGDGSYLRNLTFDTVNGVGDNTNHTAGLWISQLPYSVLIDRLFVTGTDFGSVMGPPTNNYTFMTEQSSCNGISWNKITIRSNHGWYNLCGGQASFTNMDIYNTLGVVGWAQWAEPNDQSPTAQGLFGGGDNVFNVYNEDNGGSGEGISEPEAAFYASNDTISNAQWVSSNIFYFVGQGNQGTNLNFPNGSTNAPLIIYGQGNVLHDTGALGPTVVNSNVYGTGTVLNYGNYGGNNVDGLSAGGVPFNLSVIGTGSRAIAGLQTGEAAEFGNVTPAKQFLDLNAGIIYPGEIEVKNPTKYPNSMDGLITDTTAPFNAAVYCKGSSTSCQPQYFVPCAFSCGLTIATGSRIIPGVYTVYVPYRTSTGTPTSTIALQVWTGGVATTVATAGVTNSTSWQVLEFDNVNLGAYAGYTIGLLTNGFSSSTANYYIGGVEMSPLPQKFQVQNLVVNGTCTGCGGGGGSTAFQANGTPLSSSSTVNFENSAATNGLTLTFTNPSSGNVQLGLSGTLTNAGLTNSGITLGSTSVSLGGTISSATGFNAATATLATTASALAGTPTLCSTGNAPTGILANGNATGCQAIGTGGGGPTIQTNSVNNPSQTLLNFVSTATGVFSSGGGGVVNLSVPTATNSNLGVSKPDNTTISAASGTYSVISPGASTILGFSSGNAYTGYTAGANISLASNQITDTNPANTVSSSLTTGTIPVATGAAALGNSQLTTASGSTILGSGTNANTDGWGHVAFSGSTTFTFTFANAYAVAPECVATPLFLPASGVTYGFTTLSTTGWVLTFSSPVTGNVSYHCDKHT
jgi:hypothetical protein